VRNYNKFPRKIINDLIFKVMNTVMIVFFWIVTSISATVVMMAEPQNKIQPPPSNYKTPADKKVCRGDINKEGVVCTSWDVQLPENNKKPF